MSLPGPVRVAALYQFSNFPDPAAFCEPLSRVCTEAGIKGTLLLAHEGINGTIAGATEGLETVLTAIRALPGCAGLEVKFSDAETMPFHRMKVRLKAEIVTFGVAGLDPTETGHYVEPEDWNALIADPDTVLIDTRNDYEVQIGTFPGAINPQTTSFREFPDWFRAHRAAFEAEGRTPNYAMFCTGGIRCEKATAFLRGEGIEAVHHLKGGILRYLEKMPAEESVWQGECFVFDQRVAVGQGLSPGTHELCHGCRRPVGPDDRLSPLYERGVQCPACATERDDAQRERYAERQRQVDLAAARGGEHLGSQSETRPGLAGVDEPSQIDLPVRGAEGQ